jgi:hypothetical protein
MLGASLAARARALAPTLLEIDWVGDPAIGLRVRVAHCARLLRDHVEVAFA